MKNLLRNRSCRAVAGFVLCFAAAVSVEAQTSNATTTPSPIDDLSPKGAIAQYREFSKYPPESRPLKSSNWDLLHPWTVDTPTLPLTPASWTNQMQAMRKSGLSQAAIAQQIGTPASFPRLHFEVNKLVLAGTQDELIARLTISPAPDNSTTLPSFHVAKAEVIGDANVDHQSVSSVPFACVTGTHPVCTFSWKAPAAEKKYWGALKLQVTIAMDGQTDEYVAPLHFYSSPIVAGKFTGGFQERVEDGSLLIDAGVSVQKRMACFASANLYSADNEIPTHHAERRMIVDPSMKTITFTFFGKIFKDNGYAGAFRLQDLKVQCENLPFPPEWFMDSSAHLAELEAFKPDPTQAAEPSRVYFEYNNFTYTTKSYSNTAFSDKEWQSPERTRKLELMQKAAQQLEDNAAAMEARKQQLRSEAKPQ